MKWKLYLKNMCLAFMTANGGHRLSTLVIK